MKYLYLAALLIAGSFYAHAQEICGNGIDDDGNGLVDCYDPACYGGTPPEIRLFFHDNYCHLDTQWQLQALPGGGLFTGPGVNGGYFNPMLAGPGQHTISYTVFDGSCSFTKDSVVTVHEFPIANAGPDKTTCVGRPVILGTDSVPNTMYFWIWPSNLNNFQLAQPTGTYYVAGSYSYIMYIIAHGCANTDTVTVNVLDMGLANAGLDWAVCVTDTFIDLNAGTPTGGVWNGAGIIDSVNGYVNPTLLGAGIFPLSYTNYQVCATDTILMNVFGLASIGISADTTVCVGEPIQLQATGGDYITWEPPLYLNDPMIANPVSTTAIDITYAVTVFNDSTCPNTDSVHITVLQSPAAGFTISSACEGSESAITDLAQPSALTYTWNMGDGTTLNDTLTTYTYVNDGTYTVTQVVNNGACTDTARQSVVIGAKPVADFTVDNACEGVATFINDLSQAQPGAGYTWHMGDGTTANNPIGSHTYNNAGSYEVMQVINLGLCTDTAVKYVLVSEAPLAGFDYTNVDEHTVSFNNTSQGSESWQWLFGDGAGTNTENPNHHYNHGGDYNVWLVAVSDKGCSDSTLQIITITDITALQATKEAIFIPNAFSPNGDGNNDVWRVYTNAPINYFSLTIYNRWGEKIYANNNPNTGWDGTYKGELQSPQSYIYILSIVLQNGESRSLKGGLMLLK